MLVVSWGSGVDARGLLRRAVAAYCDVSPASVTTGSLCPECSSTEHGRPYARIGSEGPAPHVSLSRGGGIVVVAVTDAGPVGVDVEPSWAASFAGFDQVVLHPAERADGDAARTRTWVRKESLLKATGDGLRVDPREVRLSTPWEPPAVLDWPALREPVWLYDLEPAPGFTAAVAVLARERPPLVLREVPFAQGASASRAGGHLLS
ncbi:MAG: 4'-phosphopantetheinyl transferase superfamily protein [Candidatus Nanopelagicales bacterium]